MFLEFSFFSSFFFPMFICLFTVRICFVKRINVTGYRLCKFTCDRWPSFNLWIILFLDLIAQHSSISASFPTQFYSTTWSFSSYHHYHKFYITWAKFDSFYVITWFSTIIDYCYNARIRISNGRMSWTSIYEEGSTCTTQTSYHRMFFSFAASFLLESLFSRKF